MNEEGVPQVDPVETQRILVNENPFSTYFHAGKYELCDSCRMRHYFEVIYILPNDG